MTNRLRRFLPGRVEAAVGLGLVLAVVLMTWSGCATWTYLGYRLAPDYPGQGDEVLMVDGLRGEVRITVDDLGVPHIEAGSAEDLLFATGFVHARDRFFEMDLMRRIARGRLSELVGEQPFGAAGTTTVELDRTMRGWGFDRGVAEDLGSLDQRTRGLLDAYVRGVNQALGTGDYVPIEHRLLGVEPEPWTVEDTVALGLFNGWIIFHNWRQETCRLLLALRHGPDRAEAIYGWEPWEVDSGFPATAEAHELPEAVVPEIRELFERLAHGHPAHASAAEPDGEARAYAALAAMDWSGASNAWVVGGDRSSSGKPLLASDPHLLHMVPSVMYQLHLRAPGVDAIGVSIPGLPGLLIGHNEQVAWGMTAGVVDSQDLYVEQPAPGREAMVLGPTGPEPLAVERVVVRVRGEDGGMEERTFTIRRTKRGPVLQDLYPGLLPDYAPMVTVHFDVSGATRSLGLLFDALSATTTEELGAAVQGSLPPNVWIVGDVHGTVGMFAGGKVPIRPAHLGTFPVPAWVQAYQWAGFARPEDKPRVVGGPESVLVHANNLTVPPRLARVPYHVDSGPGYRHDRILELLRGADRHDSGSFRRIQLDQTMLRVREVLPRMLEDLAPLAAAGGTEAKALALLEAWDGVAGAGSTAAALFQLTYWGAARRALDDELEPPGLAFVLSQRYSGAVFDRWYSDPRHPAWDDPSTDEVETRRDAVVPAFEDAVARLTREQGPDPDGWSWGALHVDGPRHPFGSREALAGLFNMPEHPAGGGQDTVWQSHFDVEHREPFRVMAGPVLRMVVDLAAVDRARWVIDTGASGWPGSPHYSDQHEAWYRGELLPMWFTRQDVQAHRACTVTLTPRR